MGRAFSHSQLAFVGIVLRHVGHCIPTDHCGLHVIAGFRGRRRQQLTGQPGLPPWQPAQKIVNVQGGARPSSPLPSTTDTGSMETAKAADLLISRVHRDR